MATADSRSRRSIGAVLYGLLFCAGVPALMTALARATADWVALPLPSPAWGVTGIFAGTALMLAGFHVLWTHGRGLPMNAYPPPRWVAQGIYRWLPHPIYLGFVAASFGIATLAGSDSGVWLVTPLAAAGCAALLAGYELPALDRHFGPDRPRALLCLPPATDQAALPADRWSVYVLLLLPWAVGYEAFVLIGPAVDARSVLLPMEQHWPVIEWTELPYAGCYLWVLALPWLPRRRVDIRRLLVAGWIGCAVGFALFALLPVVSPAREFAPQTALGHLILWERAKDSPAAALPAFHAFWGWIAAVVTARASPRWRVWIWAGGGAIAASCITTGAHALADVAAGSALAAVAWHGGALWRRALSVYQRLANSWRAWRIGPVRIVNHALYAGAAGGVALVVAAAWTSAPATRAIALCAVGALVGGALWAQWVEGSPRLLRPFGFFGAVIGFAVAAPLASLALGAPLDEMAAGTALGAAWAIAIGRLRCAVQGCCHGRPLAAAWAGVRHVNAHSRVCALTLLRGVPLHPTPLYAALAHVVVALALLRLAALGWGGFRLLATFLVATALERFVEEAYRGEPQTPHRYGLSLYQWAALALFATGIALAFVPPAGPPSAAPLGASDLLLAGAVGLLAALAMSVDLPASTRPFARLTG